MSETGILCTVICTSYYSMYLDFDACVEHVCVFLRDCPAHVWATVLKALVKFAAVSFSDSVFCVGRECCVTPPPHHPPTAAADHSQTTHCYNNNGGRLSNMFTARSLTYSSHLPSHLL